MMISCLFVPRYETSADYVIHTCIRKTCPCNEYPLKPHFYIVKLWYARVYLFFLFLVQNIDCGYSLELPAKFFIFSRLKRSSYIAWACFGNVTQAASMARWLSYLPCSPGVVGSIHGFLRLSNETLNTLLSPL